MLKEIKITLDSTQLIAYLMQRKENCKPFDSWRVLVSKVVQGSFNIDASLDHFFSSYEKWFLTFFGVWTHYHEIIMCLHSYENFWDSWIITHCADYARRQWETWSNGKRAAAVVSVSSVSVRGWGERGVGEDRVGFNPIPTWEGYFLSRDKIWIWK